MARKKHHSSARTRTKRRKARIRFVIALLIIAIVLLGVYAAVWYLERSRIISDSRKYQNMYTSAPTNTPAPTATPTAEPSPVITESPTPAVTDAPTAVPTVEVTATPTMAALPVAVDATHTPVQENTVKPLATPNENTLVFALPTPPPVQETFDGLLSMNGDTVGFLKLGQVVALPVVQRANDNDFYLNHNFEQEPANEGTLFLDGSNLLVPEDDCLIIYGHNMKNDTMFGCLEYFADMNYLKKNALCRFDTIYENRSYVPFAAFAASMDKNSSSYFDVRQFVFDENSLELFALKMQARSSWKVPVDVRWGDDILLLVTCDYTNTDGRFILALRRLRPDETEDSVRALINQVRAN